jgi:hypothetical protein
MFISFSGEGATPPPTSVFHIMIAHPGSAATLVLDRQKDGVAGYDRVRGGFLTSEDDRSITGGLAFKGNRNALKTEWQGDFLVRRTQFELFEKLLLLQQNTNIPLSLLDRFNGESDAKNVWIDVDKKWLTPVIMGRWWQLQFRARER